MTKRMLIDNTQPEETRVVVINGYKLEEVEFETSSKRQIKSNVYLGKIMRVEPSLQACFVDYGGNKHGFMAFGEIHPDYYNIPAEEMEALDNEVNDIIEGKKQALKNREAERERIRAEKAIAREKALKEKEEQEQANKANGVDTTCENSENAAIVAQEISTTETSENTETTDADTSEDGEKKIHPKKRVAKKRYRKQPPKNVEAVEGETPAQAQDSVVVADAVVADAEPLKVSSASNGIEDETISEDLKENSSNENDVADDDDEMEMDFELQKKLMKARKLFHRCKIQNVIKEGQTVLVQVVKEERGNKGAALTTYLSLAGRYCVLMPNRIKSGGVSRKITNANDRNRLKGIVRDLPLTSDMSMIVRTAGEEKSKPEIIRDYNYLIRTWNLIRDKALTEKAPFLIHEEGNLIKRALRDIYTKEISEILVAGEETFKIARDFFKILSPHSLKKIKLYRNNEMPLFQRFQVEGQLDRLHEETAQLESGGYLVINPTEALISIDVNSGRATKEKDLEDTALKTNLEACDEVAKQLRMRNLAGLVVIDFIDMEEPANNHAVEKRMKEAMKKDRSRIQIGKMSMFGLLELSRQRMHSSFFENNYQVCPYCNGKGISRTTESSAVFVLRVIEEEGSKNRSSRININIPTDVAIYLLNQKRQMLVNLQQKYTMDIIISADDSIKYIGDYKIERIKRIVEITTPATPIAQNPNQNKNPNQNRNPNQNNKRNQRPNKVAPSENVVKNVEEETKIAASNVEVSETPVKTTEIATQNTAETNVMNNTENNKENSTENSTESGTESGTENSTENNYKNNRKNRGRDRRYRKNNNKERFNKDETAPSEEKSKPSSNNQEAIILYNSHADTTSKPSTNVNTPEKEKATWWKKLIKG